MQTTFEQICKENYSRIFKYILAATGNKEQTENLTQEVFYIALKKGDRFLQHDIPEAFLYKTAKNLVLEYFRKSKKYITEELDENISLPQSDVFNLICQQYDDRVNIEAYRHKVLDMLSVEDRQLYDAHYKDRLPMREISKNMQMTETAIRMRYVRLRKRIRHLIKQLQLSDF